MKHPYDGMFSGKKTKTTQQEVKLFICVIWFLKKIHHLRIGTALTYSWTSFPIILPFSGCSIAILTWLILKPYKHAVILEVSHRLFFPPAMLILHVPPDTSPASTGAAFFGFDSEIANPLLGTSYSLTQVCSFHCTYFICIFIISLPLIGK